MIILILYNYCKNYTGNKILNINNHSWLKFRFIKLSLNKIFHQYKSILIILIVLVRLKRKILLGIILKIPIILIFLLILEIYSIIIILLIFILSLIFK